MGLVKLDKRNFIKFYGKYFHYLYFIRRVNNSNIDQPSVDLMIQRMFKIYKENGVNHFILYLKTCLWAMNCFLGDIPVSSTRVTGTRIKLSRGLPYIIPTNFRREIRKGNLSYIHIIGSILQSYKGLQGEYKEPDLSSILMPPIDVPLESFENFVTEYIKRRPAKGKIEDYGDTPDPIILSAGPNSSVSVLGIYEDATALHSIGAFPLFEDYATITGHEGFLEGAVENDFYCLSSGEVKPSPKERLTPGKLSLKYEAAGKVRVFAIVDYFTQWLLKPLHDFMFDWLRHQHSDATFNQNEVLNTFVKNNLGRKFWSFDLKSATDLIPKQLYSVVLRMFLPPEAIQIWNQLCSRPFRVPDELTFTYGGFVKYGRGQPMGMLSSWAALASCHHMLVRFAYFRYTGSYFIPPHKYLVLGDDIVISEEELANSYKEVCKMMEIPLSLYKSYECSSVLNFASQTYNNKGENLSPISLKEVVQMDRLSRKLEFSYRLIHLGYIRPGLPSQFKVFFSPDSWKQESTFLTRGTFTSYGKRVYRSLLQPSGRNSYHISHYLSAFKSRFSLSDNSVKIEDGDYLISGLFPRYLKYPRNSFLVYSLYKEITNLFLAYHKNAQRIYDDLEEMLLLSSSSILRSPGTDWVIPKDSQPHDLVGIYRFIPATLRKIERDRDNLVRDLASAGYGKFSLNQGEEGEGLGPEPKFSALRYISDLLTIASRLPVYYRPYSFKELRRQAELLQDEKRRQHSRFSKSEARIMKIVSSFYPQFRLSVHPIGVLTPKRNKRTGLKGPVIGTNNNL